MSVEMYVENICNHFDNVFEDDEIDIDMLMTVRDNEEDEDCMTPKLYPSFKCIMNTGKPYKFFVDNKQTSMLLIDLILGMFGFKDYLCFTNNKKYQALEFVDYYLKSDFSFNIFTDNMDMNKNDLFTFLYIGYLLQSQNYSSFSLPEIDTDRGQIIDMGTAEFYIEEQMIWRLNKLSHYCQETFTERKKQLKQKSEKNDKETKKLNDNAKLLKKKTSNYNVIHDIDMKIKQKYFDMIYEDLFGHIDTSNLSNPRSHRNDLKRKFMKQDPFDKETKKIDYTLHAFVVYFNTKVDRILTC